MLVGSRRVGHLCLDRATVSSTLHGSNAGGNQRGSCLSVLLRVLICEAGHGEEGHEQHILVGVLACVEEVDQPREGGDLDQLSVGSMNRSASWDFPSCSPSRMGIPPPAPSHRSKSKYTGRALSSWWKSIHATGLHEPCMQ